MNTMHKLHALQLEDDGHEVDQSWLDDKARALESRARGIVHLLHHIEDVERANESEFPKLVDALRVAAGFARTAGIELMDKARETRAAASADGPVRS